MSGIFVIIGSLVFCILIFVAIGLYAIKRKSPMHFFAGTTVNPRKITDVEAYNRANGYMWFAYGGLFIIPIIASFFTSPAVVGILVGIVTCVGTILLFVAYGLIYKHYKI